MQTTAYDISTSESVLSSQVELSFSCAHLPSLDALSASDPRIIVYIRGKYLTKLFANFIRPLILLCDHSIRGTEMEGNRKN